MSGDGFKRGDILDSEDGADGFHGACLNGAGCPRRWRRRDAKSAEAAHMERTLSRSFPRERWVYTYSLGRWSEIQEAGMSLPYSALHCAA